MALLSGKQLSEELRQTCEAVERRLWIASPFIGGWANVRRVLGKSWWNRKIDVRLLTDESTGPNGITLSRFAQQGLIYHLLGLHAKIYIIDDKVLLTSANLTGKAFSSRYEVGVFLSGVEAESAIALFVSWVSPEIGRDFDFKTLERLSKRNHRQPDDDPLADLPQLWELPPDPGDFGGDNRFLDYSRFLHFYATLAAEYLTVQRIWPTLPANFEVDGFIESLYHKLKLSTEYSTKAPRKLSRADRQSEIRKLAHRFKDRAEIDRDDGQWRADHSAIVQELLSKDKIEKLTRAGIEQVLIQLNCMSNDRRRPAMFLKRNTTAVVRDAWTHLLYDSAPVQDRMSRCAERLSHFKESGIQELLGFYDPTTYPLRTKPVNAGLRFFGFDI